MQPRYALPFLQPGRLARVLTSNESVPSGPDDTDAAHEVILSHCCCPSVSCHMLPRILPAADVSNLCVQVTFAGTERVYRSSNHFAYFELHFAACPFPLQSS